MAGDVPVKYVQLYANYDKSFVDKVRTLKVRTQDRTKNDVNYSIPCVFATPERAFAQIKSQIARRRGIQIEQIKTVPLPIASLTRVTQSIDLSRYVRHRFNRLYYVPSEDKYIGMDRPNPWDMVYQVDVWARTFEALDDLTTQINLWLRADEFYLTVNHPFPMNERIVLTQFQGMADNSRLNTGTEEKRTLRRTFTFVVHGWVVHPEIDADIVRQIIVDFYDNTDEFDPEFMERVVVTSTDEGVTPPDPVEPEPEDDTMGKITTTLYGLLIPGEVAADDSYGNFSVPAAATITGMSVAVLGRPPTGDDLVFELTLDGTRDSTRGITLPAGSRRRAVVFDDSLDVVAGNVLGVYCTQIGSGDPADWVEVRFDAEISVEIT